MGFTIHYTIETAEQSEPNARRLVDQLHQKAITLDLVSVSDLIELTGAECDLESCDGSKRPLVFQGSVEFVDEDEFVMEPPSKIIAFVTHPGSGSEAARFGLCQRQNGKWNFSSFCKTQYASNAKCGGLDNFIKAHKSVVTMLDYASEIGLTVKVKDESGYWKHRDTEMLKLPTTKAKPKFLGVAILARHDPNGPYSKDNCYFRTAVSDEEARAGVELHVASDLRERFLELERQGWVQFDEEKRRKLMEKP
ncbi:hypothetical protein [Thalassoroseus pseudoceratinae]|uniref:hypothetical protein n=1 Tax=Thalassoroseus pseudoceratinae TaxID=2713176 RepID=UPI0014215646|nr:hypothetical protein [Thalassoroseus pseudoceratinae]